MFVCICRLYVCMFDRLCSKSRGRDPNGRDYNHLSLCHSSTQVCRWHIWYHVDFSYSSDGGWLAGWLGWLTRLVIIYNQMRIMLSVLFIKWQYKLYTSLIIHCCYLGNLFPSVQCSHPTEKKFFQRIKVWESNVIFLLGGD